MLASRSMKRWLSSVSTMSKPFVSPFLLKEIRVNLYVNALPSGIDLVVGGGYLECEEAECEGDEQEDAEKSGGEGEAGEMEECVAN